ncbi:hypothetical protein FPSE_05316 [Fusarium pseudograminearum CS3096]|uniref:Uncharacterized protein n=1 Tax=Fusarium pseudograminearum (strain CS3096) TaxID=1028729 RepID=K3UQ80_FUSPC|nr:hypothetical protein FPSE_05316 [Fusarium pseudograminearum CS3096]EKJ74566.1 hypothetical protein FPSE_05316 [Fusarium pseudograminearum CS3096]
MRSIETRRLAAFLALPFLCNGFTVTVDRDTTGKSIAQAIFNGPGLTLVNWDLRAPADSLGAFTDGPFGIGNGGILTTGQASGAMPGGDGNVDNGGDGADIFCGLGSTNAAVVYAGVTPGAGYNGIRIEFVFATNEPDGGNPDNIGIFNFDNTPSQFATFNVVTVPVVPELQADIYIVICDKGNSGDDSALLIKGYGCTDCESTPNGAEINYVKQTTTLERGEQPYTQTISASGTASGTFIYFVAPEETTTTMAAETTTADTTTTTAMAEDTTTTSAAADVPTDTTSSDGSTTINDETSFGSTTAMVTDPTTSTASGTTAEFTTTDEPTSTIESASEQTTTKRSPCRPRRHLH